MEAENKSAIDLDISDSDRRRGRRREVQNENPIAAPAAPAAALGSIFTTESVFRLFTQQRMFTAH